MTDPEKAGSKPAQENSALVEPAKSIEVPLLISISGGSGSAPPKEKGWRKLFEASTLLTIGGLMIGAGTFGFNMARIVSTDLVKSYEKDNTRLENENKDLKTKLTSAETERDLAKQEARLTDSGQRTGASPTSPLQSLDAQVPTGETVKMFRGQLFITLVSVESTPTDSSFVASMTFGSLGKANASVKGRPGDVMTFNGFEIRITSVDAVSATVRVQRLPAAIQQQP